MGQCLFAQSGDGRFLVASLIIFVVTCLLKHIYCVIYVVDGLKQEVYKLKFENARAPKIIRAMSICTKW